MATNKTKASSSATVSQKDHVAAAASRMRLMQNEEKYELLWLDEDVNESRDNMVTQKKLRQAINQFKTFDNIKECEKYIHQIEGTHKEMVLIVSGKFGRELIPRIHDTRELNAFYVYCMNKESNKQWADNYQKSQGVYTESEKLIDRLTENQRLMKKVDASSIGISTYSRNISSKLENRNAMFMYLQIFIEIIIKMRQSPEKGRKDLLDVLKEANKENDKELKFISEFEQQYTPEKAIWWYTRETCFYHALNKALREHDFGLLLLFRFFIIDLYEQLVTEHENYLKHLSNEKKPILHVFRGSRIYMDELNTIRENIGEFISMNSFLSTAIDEKTAWNFAELVEVTEDKQRILFEIDIDIRLNNLKPFANIRHLSFFQEIEDEVLIMLGSIFQIKDIKLNEKRNTWIAKLSLCSDDDYVLKDIFAYEKKILGPNPGLIGLGRMLGEMGNYKQANSILAQALAESQSDFERQDCYLMLGAVARLQDDYDTSLKNYLNCLAIQLELYSNNHPHTAQTYSEIADLYWRKKDFDSALEYAENAFDILPTGHGHRANVYRTMANVYRDSGKLDLAVGYYNKALEIQKQKLPKDHNHIGRTYNQIGVVYELQHDYPMALQSYKDALRILKKTLPPTHEEVQEAENHIRDVKNKMK